MKLSNPLGDVTLDVQRHEKGTVSPMTPDQQEMAASLRKALELAPDSTIQELAKIDLRIAARPVFALAILETMERGGLVVRGNKSTLYPRNYRYRLAS